jgi:enamine deaminase RidA (YjgF/YER057c/UK114 family)
MAAYCRAVRAGPFIAVSGCAAINSAGEVESHDDVYAQTRAALRIAIDAVNKLGGSATAVIRTRLFLVHGADWQAAIRAHADAFHGIDPANTTLFVNGFIPIGALVEVELDAYVSGQSPVGTVSVPADHLTDA